MGRVTAVVWDVSVTAKVGVFVAFGCIRLFDALLDGAWRYPVDGDTAWRTVALTVWLSD